MRRIIVNITERGLDGDPLLIEAESVDSAIKELKELTGVSHQQAMQRFMDDKKEKLSRFTDSIFGWDHDDDGNMIPNWEEQSIITAMKAMRDNDRSFSWIANFLNKMGEKGKRGGKWQSASVARIMRIRYTKEFLTFDRSGTQLDENIHPK